MTVLLFSSEPLPLSAISYEYAEVSDVAGNNYCGVSMEDNYGEFKRPNLFLPVNGFSFDETSGITAENEIRASVGQNTIKAGVTQTGGSFTIDIAPIGTGYILRSLLQSRASSEDAVHTIVPARSDESLSISLSLSNRLVVEHSGAIITSMSISAAFNEVVNASVDFVSRATRISELYVTDPTYYEVDPLTFQHALLTKDGVEVADVTGFGINIGNTFETLTLLSGSTRPSRMYNTNRAVSVAIDVDNISNEFYAALLAKEAFRLELDLASGSLYYRISLPVVYLSSASVSLEPFGGTQEYSGVAVETKSSPIVEIVVSNEIQEFL